MPHIPEPLKECVSFQHAFEDFESLANSYKFGHARDCVIGRFPLAVTLKIFLGKILVVPRKILSKYLL